MDSLRDAVAVFAPTDCAGCATPDRALCAACRSELEGVPTETVLGSPSSALTVHASAVYAGAVRSILLSFKDGGRTDCARILGLALRKAIAAAIAADANASQGLRSPVIELVTIPSGRAAFRRRGYHPVELMLRKGGLRSVNVLRPARQTDDQAGLNFCERAENRENSLKTRVGLSARRFVIVDDILTTGATIVEARRALEAAGAYVAGAATIAVTRRRNRPSVLSAKPPQIPDDNPMPRVYG